MAAPQPSFARTLLTHGLGFGVFLTLFSWARDAFEGDVPPWPSWAFVYGLVGVLGGFFYGGLYWWLDRRSARRG
jgi:apolipoprotein N-acyltransferase